MKNTSTVYLIASIVLMSILFASSAMAQIIPEDRRIDWTHSGVPGGIPHRTNIFRTIDASIYGDGTIDATSVIQAALNECIDGQVVYLPAGHYKIMKTIDINSNTTLRGDGPGQTILQFGGGGRTAVHMDAGVYSQIINAQNIVAVTGGITKGSMILTVSENGNMNIGDILHLDQLNDGTLVDADGVEGFCSYCGRGNGTRTLGQILKITGVDIAAKTITIQAPLNYTYSARLSPEVVKISARNYIDRAGVEDLTITQSSPLYSYLVEMQGTQNSWLRNVEIENIDWRAVWLLYGLQNEIRECYIHTSINGYGRSHGYGIYMDQFSTANLIENNVFKTIDGGGIMLGSGASGNVIAYNIISDHRFDDYWWVNGSPSLNHNPHPMMNLWEGNVGDKLEADFIHGSSSHNTVFRSRSRGWQNDSATTANASVALAKRNTYYNIIGCVLGTAGKSNRYEVTAGETWNSADLAIWLLGVTCTVTGKDVLPTLLRHGNFDYFTNTVKWDSNISDHRLPPSLYLLKSPYFFASIPWPPIGPDVTHFYNKIPAEHWLDQSSSIGFNSAPEAQNQVVYTAVNTPIMIRPFASDMQNDYLRYFIVNDPMDASLYGDLFWKEEGLLYQPSAGFTGTDSFAFFASDARLRSNIGKITIRIENKAVK
jgi:hypothetical protein